MKKSFAILSLFWIVILSGCWSKSLTVQEYNDSLVTYTDECISPTQDLWLNFDINESSVDSVLSSLKDCINTCKSSRDKASDLWKFEWDDSLRAAVETVLDTYVEYLETFAQTSKYRALQEMPAEEKTEYESLSSKISTLLASLEAQTQNLQDIQKVFAEKYWLKLSS